MEMTVDKPAGELTLGPVLFNWSPEGWRDFYFRIADEAPVAAVYLGEAVCFKRAPLFEPYLGEVAARLTAAGKAVVLSTLAEVMSKQERNLIDDVCASDGAMVEANDGSALMRLGGRPHHVGPFVNVYNERTVNVLIRNGARNICLPPEMPATAIRSLCAATADLDVTVEVQVFGRMPLALSARCYHARAHGRTKDSCKFICDNDPDCMTLRTIEDKPILTVNGIQTMSHDYLNLIGELTDLQTMGVTRFRLSPHSCDMIAVADIFRAALDQRIDPAEATRRLNDLKLGVPFSNGFFHGQPGHDWRGQMMH
jgi:O2-independent ubiquinone biosynthesis protein UbiV